MAKFWSPTAWVLEAAFVIEIGPGKYVEAAVIAALLLFTLILDQIKRPVTMLFKVE